MVDYMDYFQLSQRVHELEAEKAEMEKRIRQLEQAVLTLLSEIKVPVQQP